MFLYVASYLSVRKTCFGLSFSVATNMKMEMVPMSCQKYLMLLLQTQLDHTEIVRNIQWFIYYMFICSKPPALAKNTLSIHAHKRYP